MSKPLLINFFPAQAHATIAQIKKMQAVLEPFYRHVRLDMPMPPSFESQLELFYQVIFKLMQKVSNL